MQVILKLGPRTATARSPKTGETRKGALHFEVKVFAAGEEDSAWAGSSPSTAAEWLRQVGREDTIAITPPSVFVDVPPADVPAAALRSLPSDALVAMDWTLALVKTA